MPEQKLIISSLLGTGLIVVLAWVMLADDEPERVERTVVESGFTEAPLLLPSQTRNDELPEARDVDEDASLFEPLPEPPPIQAEVEEPPPAPAVEEEVAAVELPPLNESDGFVQSQLDELPSSDAMMALLVDEHLLRKFVVLVENVSQGMLPLGDFPYQPLDTPLPVRRMDEESYLLEAAAHGRYEPYLAALEAVEAEALVALYGMLNPLLQRGLEEIGYRDIEFTDLLQAAIDRVLSAEVERGPFLLERPSVSYRFADPRLESDDDVEKLLMRMGPENEARLKALLRRYRQALAELP